VSQIHVLLKSGADPSIADSDGETPLALAVSLRRKEAEKALRKAGAPEQGKRPSKQPSKAPAIDLRKDAKQIDAMLKSAIRKFVREKSASPLTGVFLAVSGIEGYVIVSFDTSGADNPWDASHTDYARKEFPKWRYTYELAASGVKITQRNGNVLDWPKAVGDVKFERPFLELCIAVLKSAEESQEFDRLSRASSFELGVQASLVGEGRAWKPKIARSTTNRTRRP
jgi:hypothetical protein